MRGKVRLWWQQAKADLEIAEVNLKAGRHCAAVFFCQQAVEKSLKALLLRKKRSPQSPEMFRHSLIHLGKTCRTPKKYHSFLRDLTCEYVNTRYSTAAEEAPQELYDHASWRLRQPSIARRSPQSHVAIASSDSVLRASSQVCP